MKTDTLRKLMGSRSHVAFVTALAFSFVAGPVVVTTARAADEKKPAPSDVTKTVEQKKSENVPVKKLDKADPGLQSKLAPMAPNKMEGAAGEAPKPIDPNAPKPVIKCEQATHDFGTMWAGPDLKHEFVIRNEGVGPLEITKVRPACGCTIAGEYPKTIAPGESGKFPFSIKSDKLRNRFEKTVTVSSNDPTTPDLQLKLAGEVKRYVDVTPATVNFAKVAGKDQKEQKVAIVNNGETPLKLTLNPPAEGEKFKYELVETTPGKNWDFVVRMPPPYETGQWRSTAVLTTDNQNQKTVEVPVLAIVPERLEVQPAELTVAGPGGKPAPKRLLRFTNYGETPAKVTKAECSDEKVKVSVTEETEGKAYRVDVEWPGDYVAPEGGAIVTLHTDDAKQPKIAVPIKAGKTPKDAMAAAQNSPDNLIGKPAPQFSVTTNQGKALSNADMMGKVTALTFFAPNCGFCKKSMPRVDTLRPQYEPKGVRFVNIAESMRKTFTEDETKKILEDVKVTAELAMDMENKVGPLFFANSFPTQILIGKTGLVEAVNSGNVADLESRLSGQLDAMLAGKPVPAPPPKPAQPPATPPPPPAQELVGKPAPAFDVKTIDGKSVSVDEIKKSPATVLNFVAPNCGYCKKQLPRIEALRTEYEAKGIRFVNVSEKMGTKEFTKEETVEIFKTQAGSNSELALDTENKVGLLYRASGYPTMIIVGKSGNVEAVNVGNVADLETRMKGQLDALIAGKPLPVFEAPKAAEAPKQQKPAMEMVGKQSPQFTVNTVAGKPVSDAEFTKAGATILNFVAPNCGFCKKQIPIVDAIRKEYEAKGVRFVNMSQTMRKEFTVEEAQKIYTDAGSGLEFAQDKDNKVGQAFQATSYPTMVVVGKDGKVANVIVGAAADLDQQLRKQLDTLLGSAGK
ncbi:MAG: redoxin domain-containing protein [Planctomycetota bacterium]